MAQDGPKTAPRRPQDGPKMPQDGPKMAQHGPNMAQDVLKMVLRWHLGLHTSKMASKSDGDTAIVEGAAMIAAGILNNYICIYRCFIHKRMHIHIHI